MRNPIKYFLILILLSACKKKLDKTNAIKYWEIENYQIAYFSKIGPVGPTFYEYDIYKNEYFVSTGFIIDKDSCKLRLREKNNHYVFFDLCLKTKTDVYSDKLKLKIENVDSISIRPYDSIRLKPRESYTAPFYDTIVDPNFSVSNTKKMTKSEISVFVEKWNSSSDNGYKRLGTNYHYLITVYESDTIRKFKSLNQFFTENEIWSYESNSNDFFDEIWNEKK